MQLLYLRIMSIACNEKYIAQKCFRSNLLINEYVTKYAKKVLQTRHIILLFVK
jgi:hypothetical protein